MNFNPFPKLTSKRLNLRKIEESDTETILFLRSDETINKFIERPKHRQTKTKADALKFIKTQHINIRNNKLIAWGITIQNKPQIIGTICLWNFSENDTIAEVGYDLNPEFHNIGIMTEALNLIIDYGFKELKLNKIEAFTHCENESSKKLLTKNGFGFIEDRNDLDNAFNIIFEIENKTS